MSELNIGGIRTVADLRAEAAAPKPEADLDRNAFLRLFTTQLQKSESAGSHEKRGFRCSTGPIFELRGHNADVGLLGSICDGAIQRKDHARRFLDW